ncbi:MAG: TetR family transcriptional regulator [Bacteroidales bacterium]|jgi:AcrR family transcriptional regulator|nr:TetR family transcriptional regulator [Bacteroidales bacterium]
MEKDLSAEERIKKAARKLFHQKGFAGTRTRDIAEEAGINLALLNYYYRSKEKLFEQIMDESIKKIFFAIQRVINDPTSSLTEKLDAVVTSYIDTLIDNPNLPGFILSEIQANPENFTRRIGLSVEFILQTALYRQLKEHCAANEHLRNLNALHIPLNMLSLVIFPFIARPLLTNISGMDEKQFEAFVADRKILIRNWTKMMLHI